MDRKVWCGYNRNYTVNIIYKDVVNVLGQSLVNVLGLSLVNVRTTGPGTIVHLKSTIVELNFYA